MKVDKRRIRVFYSKGLKTWAADYPYPGMERILGMKQYFMVTSVNAEKAKEKLIRELQKKFN